MKNHVASQPGLIVDLFAGGGGASVGIEAAMGRPIDIAVNHDPIALAAHRANHPHTRHFVTDVWDVSPKFATQGRPVDLLWCSPDCRHHSRAKGGKPKLSKVRSLAWVVTRWARDVRPTIICVENVPEFRSWGPLDEKGQPRKKECGDTFRRWINELKNLGYAVDYRILNAAHYGTPTARKRLFLVARRDGLPIQWPLPTHGGIGLLPMHSAAECIDFNLPCPSIFERKIALKPKTLRRIAQGIERFVLNTPTPYIVRKEASVEGGHEQEVAAFLAKHHTGVVGVPLDNRPLDTVTTQDHHSLVVACLAKFRGTAPNQFGASSVEEPLSTISAGGIHSAEVRAYLMTYYSSKTDKGQSLDEPTRTITCKDRLSLVIIKKTLYRIVDIRMRMLQPSELLKAQFGEYAATYDLSAAKTKKDQVRLIGNSVCPPLAKAVIQANIISS